MILFQSICKPAPFSEETDAVLERERCDYSIKITVPMAKAGSGS
jgi:choline-phosphate cytidylyltransferase